MTASRILLAFFAAEPGIEPVHALLGAIGAAKPNRPPTEQVADHNAVAVTLADGDLVDTNRLRRGRAGPLELRAHVVLVQLLDRVPIQPQFVGHGLDRAVATASSHEESKTLGVEGIVGKPVQIFGLHGTTPLALHPTNMEVEIDSFVSTGKVADLPRPLIVEGGRDLPTNAARRFFPRRWRVTTTARGSPKSPRTVAKGSNPGNR